MRAEEMSHSQVAEWYFSLSDRWPDVFPDESLATYWMWARQIGGVSLPALDVHKKRFVPYLRAGALRLLRASVGACEKCPLHQHRLAGRPVLDDSSYWSDPFGGLAGKEMPIGATSAEIMLVSEGPGQFEARTGNPFVTHQVLAGSMCAYKCGEYEKCYSPKSQLPQQPCKPVALKGSEEELVQIRTSLAEAPKFPIMTVAGILDNALTKAGLWREGWNGRQALRPNAEPKARPGTVYLTNMVKCRSCKPKSSGVGLEDVTPSVADMETCTPWLEMQIHIIQPKVVVAMGNPAIIGTTGITDPKVLSMRGNLYPGKWGLPVLVEVHPSYISRQPDDEKAPHIEQFISTLEKAKQIAEGTLVVPWMNKKATPLLLDTEFPSIDDMTFTSTFNSE